MKREVTHFISKCLVCQQVMAPRQKPVGLLQPLSVLEWKCENVSMDFSTRLLRTLKGYTVIWVVDKLTKSAHFIQWKSTYTTNKWIRLYMTEIVKLHGVPVSIISNRDVHFAFKSGKDFKLSCVITCINNRYYLFNYNNKVKTHKKMLGTCKLHCKYINIYKYILHKYYACFTWLSCLNARWIKRKKLVKKRKHLAQELW